MGEQRELAVKWALITWAGRDPDAALSASLAKSSAHTAPQRLDLEIFNRCLSQDLAATRIWVEKLPPGPVRETAMQRVVWSLAARGDKV